MARCDGFWTACKVYISLLGVLSGFSSFFVFTFALHNIHAGLWALLSFVLALFVFHEHVLFKNDRLESWHTPKSLSALRNLGLLTAPGSLGATIYYFYYVFEYNQDIHPYSDSYMLAGVWSFMAVKWSLGLLYYSYKYKLHLIREYTLF